MTGWRKRQVMIPAKEIGGELWISAADHHQAIKEALAQPERTWVGLTDEERDAITEKVIGFNSCCGWEDDYAKAIEAKLKEKNT